MTSNAPPGPPDPPNRETPRWRWRDFWQAVLLLALLIGAMHGRCVFQGLFLDDHAHFKQLRECGWSLRELVDACRLEIIGGVVDYWWLPDVTLRFFRPVAFGIMKLCYTLCGWSPAALHVCSMLWHLANCAMLLILLNRLGARPILALGVAALFAIHPGNVATVEWIAVQTELMVTAFLLGATLCWARYRGWWGDPPGSPLFAVAALGLFALALGCRENAVMLPAILLIGDWLMLRRRGRRVFGAGWLVPAGVAVALTLGYLALRAAMLGNASLPPRPYVISPGDPGFFRFIFDKTCYYLLGEFLLVPIIPFGGVVYFREIPAWFYGLTAAVLVIPLLCLCFSRRRSAVWLGIAWLFLFMLPVLPAFESPHHLYLPGIGWAILAAALFQVGAGMAQPRESRAAFVRHSIAWTLGIGFGCILGMASYFATLAIDVGQSVEDRVTDEICAATPPIQSGDTVYIFNLPILAHYVQLSIGERLHASNVRVHALTWSTTILGNRTPAELKVIDDRTLEVHVAGDRYFAGPLGRMVSGATGRPLPVDFDAPVERPDFRVERIDRGGGEAGIAALRFHFEQPLTRPGVRVFWGSRERWAAEVPIAALAANSEHR